MSLKQVAVVVLFSCGVFAGTTSWASEYSTDVESLDEAYREIYLEAQATLNDWSGGYEKLEKADYMIDSIIASAPNFLPIYIEKARLVIMMGSADDNSIEANQEALRIIQDIQAKDPKYAKPYVLAGHIYTKLGDYTSAARSLEVAGEITAEDPWLFNNWAELFGIKGQHAKAVEYAEKALILSGDNGKALVAAVYFINKYSRRSEQSGVIRDVASIVFDRFEEPSERLRIAERLISSYNGLRRNLTHAHEIIIRQEEETPNLPEARLQMARLLMAQGYIHSENHTIVAKYDHDSGAAAERVLAQIRQEESVRNRVFALRVTVAIGIDDLETARRLIDEAENNGTVPIRNVLLNRAYLHYAEGSYQKSIAIYEQLGMTSHRTQIAAYALIGKVDKLHEYHKDQVTKAPNNAWTLGNYAGFLLFTLEDIDGAIEYGERALAEMNYPLARNNLGLAVLIRASRQYNSGNLAAAQEDYRLARSIGFSRDHVEKYCGKYCSDVMRMILIFE